MPWCTAPWSFWRFLRWRVDLVLSPYDLTLVDAAACAACVLGERVCTAMPLPATLERAAVLRALAGAPRYARLMEVWRWSVPLWRAGVLGSLLDGEHADGDAGAVRARVGAGGASGPWGALAAYAHAGLDVESEEGLDLAAADLLKGGPDPGLALPVCAGLDAFAARIGAVAVRRGGGALVGKGRARVESVAQQAERRLGETVAQVMVAIPAGADAEAILGARAATAAARGGLGAAIEAALDEGAGADEVARVRSAAAEFSGAMLAHDGSARRGGAGEDGVAWARVALRRLPVDATLLAAVAAEAKLNGAGGRVRASERWNREAGRDEAPGPGGVLRVLVVEASTLAPGEGAGRGDGRRGVASGGGAHGR